MEVGKSISLDLNEVVELFKPVEGLNTVYYGQVGNGKTYAATADILELLKRGEQVVANWPIDFAGFDEREDFRSVLVSFFFGRKRFFKYRKENFRYIHPDDIENNIPFLNRLVGVHIFLDEGQWIFNSQVRNPDPEKRKLVLHGRHYCRSLNIITQRPANLFKDIRSQVNIWYKCVKRLHIRSFILFQRHEYQDMKEDLPNEEIESGRPKTYVGDRRIFASYNTHAMREENALDKRASFEVYETTAWERFSLLCSLIMPAWALRAFKRVGAQVRAIGEFRLFRASARPVEPQARSIRSISKQDIKGEAKPDLINTLSNEKFKK